MARYIDADTMIAALAKLENEYLYADGDTEKYKFVYGTLTGVRQAITYAKAQPTADVAPKSKVERLQREVNRYKRYYFHHDYDEMIAEVLDELDRFINSNCIEIKDERGIKGYVTSGIHFAIAELKKKYTEEKR